MAGPYNPPKKNQAWQCVIALADMSSPGSFKSTPTIASGDFKSSLDQAGFGNLATLPTVSPAATRSVLVVASAAEMNGDTVMFQCVDQTSPLEWAETIFSILTTS